MPTCYYLARVKHSIAFDELLFSTFTDVIQPIKIIDKNRDIRVINFKRVLKTSDPREKLTYEEILLAEGNKKYWIFLDEVDSTGRLIKKIIQP